MSIQRSDVIALVVQNIKDMAPPTLAGVPGELTEKTLLFGGNGLFDSFGLVSLIVEVEQDLTEKAGVAITIADERAMSQRHSPFRTVASLADYALMLVNENAQQK